MFELAKRVALALECTYPKFSEHQDYKWRNLCMFYPDFLLTLLRVTTTFKKDVINWNVLGKKIAIL